MIHIFLGTKAQLVKMAPVMRELDRRAINYNFIHSGQHQETFSDLLRDFDLREPDFVLHEGRDITSIPAMALWLFRILGKYGPNSDIWRHDRRGIVLVHGDTFSTLAGALLARRCGLKVAHVEAGLRSFNLFHPFPEEITRLAVFRLSDYLFAPGKWAAENLTKVRGEVIDTGANTLLDAIQHFLESPHRENHIPSHPYALASIHRFENIFRKKNLEWIIERLIEIQKTKPLLFILHPATREKLQKAGLDHRLKEAGIELRPRYGYLDFISLLNGADFLITDGGSNQEEASYLGIPCLIMRKATEREEGIGENALLSNHDNEVIRWFTQNHQSFAKPALQQALRPSSLIVDALSNYY